MSLQSQKQIDLLKYRVEVLEKQLREHRQKLDSLEQVFTKKLADAIERGFSQFEIVATEKKTTERQIKELING